MLTCLSCYDEEKLIAPTFARRRCTPCHTGHVLPAGAHVSIFYETGPFPLSTPRLRMMQLQISLLVLQ